MLYPLASADELRNRAAQSSTHAASWDFPLSRRIPIPGTPYLPLLGKLPGVYQQPWEGGKIAGLYGGDEVAVDGHVAVSHARGVERKA
jgi:hypothetical protein